MRHPIAEHDPAILAPRFASLRVGDVHRFVVAQSLRSQDRDRAIAGVIAEDAAMSPRRILGAAQREEGDRAEQNPHDVERGKAETHGLL